MANANENAGLAAMPAASAAFGPDGALAIHHGQWPGFGIEGLRFALCVNGEAAPLSGRATGAGAAYGGKGLNVEQELLPLAEGGWELKSRLRVEAPGVLNRLELLASDFVRLGVDPARVRVMTLSRYGGDVRPLAQPAAPRPAVSGEPNEPGVAPEPAALASEDVMVIYDQAAREALLIGFMSSERWQGQIVLTVLTNGEASRLAVGFDGGDLEMAAGDELALESVVILAGRDPWALLERYGDLVRDRHGVVCPESPPVSWCSWYPYRLGISEERLLAESRIAAERLKHLGLSIMEADLGWERRHLPNAFEPNERFPHGLKWLAERMGELGFKLGVWKAPFTISEFDVLAKAHPEWLVQGENGKPVSTGTWFWEPHGNTYILDLTHPGARQWLRERFAELGEAGIGYFKADFIGVVRDARAKRRHDKRLVAGGGTEAARLGAKIIHDALPDAMILNCGGPPMPGAGAWPLLYICNDTGNTGLISWEFMRANFRAVACHLWQNSRWGIIQPSCLCVGLPGTIEEARLRATAAFLSGGQIDISDTLSTLPEDRWAILEATLPPLGLTAKPVDLFEPVFHRKASDYEALCKGLPTVFEEREHTPGSVWHLRVKRDWDEWGLFACFNFNQCPGGERPELVNFTIPLSRLGLDPKGKYWAFEFWSGQFLGTVPGGRANPGGYAHPGDWQDLLVPGPVGAISLSFTGPGVKLLALRRVRPHPWPVGTSFHQSCGAELQDVRWDPAENALSGRLARPARQSGAIFICAAGCRFVSAEANGAAIPVLTTANDGLNLPIITQKDGTYWKLKFAGANAIRASA